MYLTSIKSHYKMDSVHAITLESHIRVLFLPISHIAIARYIQCTSIPPGAI